MSKVVPIMPTVEAREQTEAIVRRWRRDLPEAEVQRRAKLLRAAIARDLAVGGSQEDGCAALAVLTEAGL